MAKTKQKRPRTYRRNRPRSYREKIFESDSIYFFKLVLCVLFGAVWVRFGDPIIFLGIPVGAIPAGMIIGLILVRRYEAHQSNRKIWYATLLIVGIISTFMASGFVL